MRNLPKLALSLRTVSLLGIAVVIYMGVQSYLALPRRQMPYIPIPFAQVISYYPGASTEDVETLVSKKLEQRFSEINDVKAVYSTTKPGLSVIIVELVYGSPTKPNWDKLRNKVEQVRPELPRGVIGPEVNDEFADTAALLLAVSSDKQSYRQLKQYAETIRDRLKRIDSVGKVEIVGDQKEIVNLYTKSRFTSKDLPSLYDAARTLKQKNIVFPGAQIFPAGNVMKLETSGRISKVKDLRDIIVSQNAATGHVITVNDLFRVERTYRKPVHTIRHKQQRALVLAVTMRQGRNVIDMGKQVDQALGELRRSLPKGLRIEKVANQPKLVKESVRDFMVNLVEAIAIVLVVAMLFMGVRSGLVMAVAIPMSMLLAFVVMKLIRWDLQTISIASLIIALGMLVDNAIVITDNIYAKLEEGMSRFDAAWKGAAELTAPVLTSTLTTVAIFLPLAFMPSISGDFIRSIPVVVSTVLLASFLVAMTVTPLSAYYLLRVKRKTDEDTLPVESPTDGDATVEDPDSPETPESVVSSSTAIEPARKKPRFSVLDWIGAGYSRFMRVALRRPGLVLLVALGIFVGSCVGFALVPKAFFPGAERDMFFVEVRLPEGSDVEATARVTARIEKRLSRERDIVSYTSFIGKGPPRFDLGVNQEAQASNYALVVISTKNDDATARLAPILQKHFERAIADGQVTVKQFNYGPAVENPVEVRIFGDDLVVLRTLADRVKDHLRKIRGTHDIKDSLGYRSANLNVQVDDYRASLAGLDNQAVAEGLKNSVEGIEAGSFLEGNEVIPIRMRLPTLARQHAQVYSSLDLPIYHARGKARSTLLQLARVRPRWDITRIDRRNNSRYVTVSAKVRGILASQVVAKLEPKLKGLGFPAGYRYELAGEQEMQDEGFADLGNAMVLGIILIIILLVLQFNSLRHTAVILGTLPLSLIGALVGLYVTGNPFGFMAFLALISLMGVVVNNALVLLDFVQTKITEGLEYKEALRVAGLRRMRPILLTMLTTVGGLLPLLFTGGAMWEPLAAVLIFGLLFATLLTLVVIPCFYAVVVKDRDQRAAQNRQAEQGETTADATSAA